MARHLTFLIFRLMPRISNTLRYPQRPAARSPPVKHFCIIVITLAHVLHCTLPSKHLPKTDVRIWKWKCYSGQMARLPNASKAGALYLSSRQGYTRDWLATAKGHPAPTPTHPQDLNGTCSGASGIQKVRNLPSQHAFAWTSNAVHAKRSRNVLDLTLPCLALMDLWI